MAYSSGTLLASGGDVYTQLMAAVKAFCEAQGWTTNEYADDATYWNQTQYVNSAYTGKKLHMQKTINGTARYINMKTCRSVVPYEYYNYSQVTGMAIYGSTGYSATATPVNITNIYDAGSGLVIVYCQTSHRLMVGDSITIAGTTNYNGTFTVTAVPDGSSFRFTHAYTTSQTGTVTGPQRWSQQPGFVYLTNYGSLGANAHDIPTDVVPYYLISADSGNVIFLQLAMSKGFVGFAFGVTSTGDFFFAGSGGINLQDSNYVKRNSLLYRGEDNFHMGAMYLRHGSSWVGGANGPSNNYAGVILPKARQLNYSADNSLATTALLLYCSPDNFKGNAPLIPCYIRVCPTDNTPFECGIIPGVKYVNMKNLASLTEVTYGAETWKLFRQYALDDAYDATGGLAFLIS